MKIASAILTALAVALVVVAQWTDGWNSLAVLFAMIACACAACWCMCQSMSEPPGPEG